jgi:hypothetical protein
MAVNNYFKVDGEIFLFDKHNDISLREAYAKAKVHSEANKGNPSRVVVWERSFSSMGPWSKCLLIGESPPPSPTRMMSPLGTTGPSLPDR